MARARNIKPSLFKNELLGVEDPLLTILFAGLWTLADREGRLEDRPLRIKAEIFPYREGLDVNGYLTVLQRLGFIDRYKVGGVGIIQVLTFSVHQNPHKTEKASELPAKPVESASCAITVKAPLEHPEETEPARLIPDSLNTDSLVLIPDSGSLIPDPLTVAVPASQSPPPQRPDVSKSAAVWKAYAEAYQGRYTATPVRNAKVNKQLCLLVDRLGTADAPEVARFYLTHNGGFYVTRMHSVDLLLADAEKLRTEWATNTRMTRTQANQIDRTQSNLSVVQSVIAKRKLEGRM